MIKSIAFSAKAHDFPLPKKGIKVAGSGPVRDCQKSFNFIVRDPVPGGKNSDYFGLLAPQQSGEVPETILNKRTLSNQASA